MGPSPKTAVVRVWVFLIQRSSPSPATWLGHDVRGECSTKTSRYYSMYTNFLTLLSPFFYQGSTISLLILLPIPIVLLLHSPLMSRPSQIARKGEELGIQKPRPLLLLLHSKKTRRFFNFCQIQRPLACGVIDYLCGVYFLEVWESNYRLFAFVVGDIYGFILLNTLEILS